MGALKASRWTLLSLLTGSLGTAAAAQGATSPSPAPWLHDATAELGLVFHHRTGASGRKLLPETMGAGGCLLDADGDGGLDIYLVQSGSLPPASTPESANRLFLRRGGRFVESDPGEAADRGYGQGAVCADVDGDRDVDIYVANFGPNALYLNDGRGHFTRAPEGFGAEDPRWSSSAAFVDLDRDGDLDLYVANYVELDLDKQPLCRRTSAPDLFYCHPDLFPSAPDSVWENLGGGRFRDATARFGLADGDGKGLGVIATDLDEDGWSDLYVANDSTPNFLLRNRFGKLVEDGLAAGVALNGSGRTEAGMGVDAGDADGDGRLDLIVTNLSLETNTLYLASGDGFRDATRGAGLFAPSYPVLGFGVDLVDLDLDGDLDLTVANGDVLDNIALLNDGLSHRQPGHLLQNDGRGRFNLLDPATTGTFAEPRVARALLTGDLDDDGRPDLVVTENGGPTRVYLNHAPAGHWLGLELAGLGSNTQAIGALVSFERAGRRRVAEVHAGGSYQGSGDARLRFGLGADASPVAELHVRWPDGTRERFGPLAADRYHELRQGTGLALSAPSPP